MANNATEPIMVRHPETLEFLNIKSLLQTGSTEAGSFSCAYTTEGLDDAIRDLATHPIEGVNEERRTDIVNFLYQLRDAFAGVEILRPVKS